MKFKQFTNYHVIEKEDLNLHNTFHAARSVEWFMYAGYVAATSLLQPKNVLVFKIHGMVFTKPLKIGQIISYTSKIVQSTDKTLTAYIAVKLHPDNKTKIYDGFVTYIHVDDNSNPISHGIEVVPKTSEDKRLHEMANQLIL